jgi:hypothetical protein
MKTTAVKERPILFSGPMVRAILENRKTQTRRVAKLTDGGHVRLGIRRWHPDDDAASLACPYGQPGGRLYVRETFRKDSAGADYMIQHFITYKADGATREALDSVDSPGIGWRPSIFMPRWASRLPLEVVEVRVEKLQAITHDDAIAEGIPEWEGDKLQRGPSAPIHDYADLWDKINGKRAPWKLNPWVWVIEFKRVTD